MTLRITRSFLRGGRSGCSFLGECSPLSWVVGLRTCWAGVSPPEQSSLPLRPAHDRMAVSWSLLVALRVSDFLSGRSLHAVVPSGLALQIMIIPTSFMIQKDFDPVSIPFI